MIGKLDINHSDTKIKMMYFKEDRRMRNEGRGAQIR